MRKAAISAFIILLFSLSTEGQELSAPTNLKAQMNGDRSKIHLVWDMSDAKIAGYNLFVKSGNREEFLLWGKAGLIYNADYDFVVKSHYGKFYEFKVCAVQNFPDIIRSELSASVMIEAPSRFLPMVKINNPTVKKGMARISWEYDITASDLHGFILYLDGEEISVDKEKREYVLDNLSYGKHNVQIICYSNSGVKSNMSVKKFIKIK